MTYSTIVNIFYILVLAPLLIALSLGLVPKQFNMGFVILAILIAGYHLFLLLGNMGIIEGMGPINGDVHYVRMFDSSPGFDLPVLHIKQGDMVVWMNVGEVQHTATEVNQRFNSGYLRPGDKYSVRFRNKGTFDYYSIPQKGWMIGQIVVE